MYAAFAILAALHEGGGRTIDVSLWETALAFVSYHLIGHIETGPSRRRRERASTRSRRTRSSPQPTAD